MSRIIKKILPLVLILIVTAIYFTTDTKNQEITTTNVAQVTDGDTLTLTDGTKVRLIGINAPEKGQPYGEDATKELRRLVNGKEITLKYDEEKKDAYDRTLAYVYSNNTFVNEHQIKNGLALVETVPPNETYEGQFTEAEIDAQKNCRGLWEGLCVKGVKTQSCLQISDINADASGDDNKNMNDEWILLKSNCSNPISLENYLIKDRSASNNYTFKDTTIDPGNNIVLHSGCGEDTLTDLFWQCPQKRSSIWNNSTDQAYLYDNTGKLISTFGY